MGRKRITKNPASRRDAIWVKTSQSYQINGSLRPVRWLDYTQGFRRIVAFFDLMNQADRLAPVQECEMYRSFLIRTVLTTNSIFLWTALFLFISQTCSIVSNKSKSFS